ncbi:hypothetical protein M0805_003008 [Coniferiporia weirii]|nr:hypothetical protein M0805_003008 [Coniferiporia weirii]
MPTNPTTAPTPATATTAAPTTPPLSPPAQRNATSTASSLGKNRTSPSSLKKKNSPSPPHLLLIQEPPWYQIGSQPSLIDPAGLPIYGVPSISGYVAILPPDTHLCIVTYVSQNLPLSSWSVIGPTTCGTDVLTVEVRTQVTVRLCNYYSMSPPDQDAPSPQYPGESFLFSLPQVLATSLLELLEAQPLNDFFQEHGLKPTHALDSNSRPKDGPYHAQLTWAIPTNLPPPLPRTHCLTNDDYGEWMELAFPALVEAFKLPTTDPHLLDVKATAVVNAMETTLQPFTTLMRPLKTEVPWWTPTCGDLLKAINAAPTN